VAGAFVSVNAGAALVAVLTAFVVEYFNRAGKDPVESAKLEAIRSMLSLRRRAPRE